MVEASQVNRITEGETNPTAPLRQGVEKPYLAKKSYLVVIPTKVGIHIDQRDRFPLSRE